MGTAAKDERLAVRMTRRQKVLIERAATALDRSVTDFAVNALIERAQEVLTDRRMFNVSQDRWDEFQAVLDQPVRPANELVELLRRGSVFDE